MIIKKNKKMKNDLLNFIQIFKNSIFTQNVKVNSFKTDIPILTNKGMNKVLIIS